MFSRIDLMLGHKTSLDKFNKTEIISCIFSDHTAMKLEINHKNVEKQAKRWKLNNMLLNNEWINNEIKEGIKRYLETNENEDTTIQNLWDIMKAFLRKKCIGTSLSQETQKCSNEQPNFTHKRT